MGIVSVQLCVSFLDQWNPGFASRARTGKIERLTAFACRLVIGVFVGVVELLFLLFQLLVFWEIREHHAKVNGENGQRGVVVESMWEGRTRR